MRSNPFYSSICWVRFGMHGRTKCWSCPKEPDCNNHYNETTGEWTYPKEIISKPYCAPYKINFKMPDWLKEI